MKKQIQDIVAAIEGKPQKKGKKYVDPEEYEKMTGETAEEDPEEETDEPKEKKGKLFGSGLSIIISMGKKK